jgi:integrase
LTLADYERTVNRWVDLAPSTLATRISCFRTYSRFLWKRGFASSWVCADFERPRRPRPEDVPVTAVSAADVMAMFACVDDWQELLCLATAAYLGARRAALSAVRLRDIDLAAGTIRFQEKGRRTIVKPMPDEYVSILRDADDNGVWASPEDYLIPNRRPAQVSRSERSDKVIWETIKRLAAKAGVSCHVHALRAAFAVAYIEAHPREALALKELLGHKRVETTYSHYLRRFDRDRAMETVRDLSWGASGSLASSSQFQSQPVKAHTGFEPVLPSQPVVLPLQRLLKNLRDLPVARDPRSRR